MSVRLVTSLLLLALLGVLGCRSPRNAVDTRGARSSLTCRNTGPLNQREAEQEALASVSAQSELGATCSIASVEETANVYAVCVRIDPAQAERGRLPEHWTVEVPKSGIVQSANAGGG